MQQAQLSPGKADVAVSSRRNVLLGVSSTLCITGVSRTPAYAAGNSKVCLVNTSPVAKANKDAKIPKAAVGDMFVSRVIKGCCPPRGENDDTLDVGGIVAAGVTTFDTGDMDDGRSEMLVGKWLMEHPDQRAQVQVLTKMTVNGIFEMATFNQDNITQELGFKAKDLGSAPDMVQFYWGSWSQPKWMDALKWLADEQAEGQFKHLGLLQWEAEELAMVLDAGIKVAAVQVPFSLIDRRATSVLLPFCREKGIPVIVQSPLAGGLINKSLLGVPTEQAPGNFDSLRGKYGHLLRDGGAWPWHQWMLTTLQDIADKHKVPLSAVAIRWVLDQPGVAAVVRPATNLSAVPAPFSFRFDADDRAALGLLLQEAPYRPSARVYDYERGLGPFAKF